MRVGVITILKVNNYGAELQAYATQYALKQMGYDAEIIDYLFYKNPEFVKTALSQPIFARSIRKRAAELLYPLISGLKQMRYRTAAKVRARRFDEFHSAHTSMSPTFHSMDELYAAVLPYDVFVVGSDQVWNPGNNSSLDPYFLTFAPKASRRISYASSFGVSSIPQDARAYYKRRLQELDSIGVREENAVVLVRDLSGKEACHVLDPTLLLTKKDWLQVAAPVVGTDKPYILLYEITPCGYIRGLANHFRRELNWQVIRICKDAVKEDREGEIRDIIDAGPAEFLYLFSRASLVLTNSFHGTAFSVNFSRPFYTIIPRGKNNSSRQRSLLQALKLEDRMLIEGAGYPNLSSLSMDYECVDGRLQEERRKSFEFLKSAVDGK